MCPEGCSLLPVFSCILNHVSSMPCMPLLSLMFSCAGLPCYALFLLQGSVANFVESEQLVTLDGGRVVASYVQVGTPQQQQQQLSV